MKPHDEWTQKESEGELDTVLNELAAYRATGFTPTEVEGMKDALHTLFEDSTVLGNIRYARMAGRVLKIPGWTE